MFWYFAGDPQDWLKNRPSLGFGVKARVSLASMPSEVKDIAAVHILTRMGLPGGAVLD